MLQFGSNKGPNEHFVLDAGASFAGVREQFWKSLIESKQMTSSWQKFGFSGTFNFKE